MEITGKMMYDGLSKAEKDEFEKWYKDYEHTESLPKDDTQLKLYIKFWLDIIINQNEDTNG